MKHLLYKSFPKALDALAARLKERKFDPERYYIVLTPDRYTLKAETALFKGTGAMDCEVLTISRLCRRVSGRADTLSKEGGVMLTARAIAAVRSELGYYAHAAMYGEFSREVYETLQQIESSGVCAADIKASGATAEKLKDLAVIKNKYDELRAGCPDAAQRLKDLIKLAKNSELIKKSDIFAIGYKDATKLNRDVFEALSSAARSFTFYDAQPPEPAERIAVYSAPDAVTQYKAVASRIREYVYKGHASGARYGDVSVVCPDPKALTRILREYGIQFYADVTEALSDTPPVRLLYDLYRLRAGDSDTVTAIAKNPFSGCPREDAERLSLYLTVHRIEYGADDIAPDEKHAARAIARVKTLLSAFRGESGFCAACNAVMEKAGFEDIEKRLFGDETDLVEPIKRLLGLLELYGAEGDRAFETDAMAFFSAARAVSVKSLPRRSDRVSVCDARALRLTKCKKLFVVDFNEGVLPAATKDGGLLSDSEINATGNVVEPTAREINRRDRDELKAVISNAEDVFCSYVTADGGRRSAFLADCAVPGGITEYDYIEESFAVRLSADAGLIAANACVSSAAREMAARKSNIYYESVAAAVQKSENTAKPFVPHAEVRRKKMSVSELTHWFGCPYKRFLKDSVGLRENSGDGAADFGIIMHDFMRRWISQKPLDSSRAAVEKTVNEVLAESGLFQGSRDGLERERIIRDACDYAELNKEVIDAGDYEPDLTRLEYSFGGDITLGSDGIPFVGVIDRVDTDGARARIIDYKTGNKEFKLKKCYDGRDMQLPLYAAAIKDSVTGMFYLPLRKRYADDCAVLSGGIVKDTDVALGYDRTLASGERSNIVNIKFSLNADGSPKGFYYPAGYILDKEKFDGLIQTCLENASTATDEINSGYIERSPAADECEHCPYSGLCMDKKPRGAETEEEDA